MVVKTEDRKLNLVLVGRTGAGKSAAGNTILGEKVFKSEFSARSVTTACEKKEGNVSGRPVAVIDTPGLFDTKRSADAVEEEIMKCLPLSAPGPRAFLLVIELGRMTEEVKETVERLQEMFGEEAEKHTVLLYTHGDKLEDQTIEEFIEDTDEDFKQLVKKFGKRYHVFNNKNMSDRTQVTELLEKIDRMVPANKNIQVKDAPTGLLSNWSQSNTLRMVLVGRTGNGKSASGNTILGREAFISTADADSVTKRCEQRKGTVTGRHVELVDMPGLYDTKRPLEEIRELIAKSIILSAPGPHVFLLVIQVGRFTEEEKKTVELIQEIFGKDAAKYTVVLFTHADKLNNQKIETFVGKNKELRELVEKCGGRYHTFNNNKNKNKRDRTQVTELLEKVESMVAENRGSCYTNEMYQKAEEEIRREQERILRETEEEERKKKEEEKLKIEEEMKQREKELEEKMKRELEEKRKRMEEDMKREREAMKKRVREEELKREEEMKQREKELEEKMKRVKEEEKKRMEEEMKKEREAMKKKQQEEKQKREEEMKQREKELEEKMKRVKEEEKKKMEEELKREREAMEKRVREEQQEREEQKKKEARNQAQSGGGISWKILGIIIGAVLLGLVGAAAGAAVGAAVGAGKGAAAVGAAVGAAAGGAAAGGAAAVGAGAGSGKGAAVGAAVGAAAGAAAVGGAAAAAGAAVGAAAVGGAIGYLARKRKEKGD